jgi:Caudovirales tail fibre assembly protein, lambda gpK
MIYYSKTTNGFYNSELAYVSLPADVVEISDEVYQQMMAGQAAGQVITSDLEGHPKLIDYVPTAEQLQQQRAAQAQALLDQTQAQVLEYYEQGEPVPPALATYRAQLRQVVKGTLGVLPAPPVL